MDKLWSMYEIFQRSVLEMAKVSIRSGFVLFKTLLSSIQHVRNERNETGMKGMGNDAGVYCSV